MNTAQPTIGVTIHRVTTFEHAYEVAKRYAEMPAIRDVAIIHAVVGAPYNGRECVHWWHAWVELNGTTCVEGRPGFRLSLPREAYYKTHKVVESSDILRRYTIAQVEALHAQHGHYGPFPPSNTEGTADVVTQPPATEIQSSP